MTRKEKAKELIEKFECYVDYQGDDCFNEREKMLINAKKCALIAVNEIETVLLQERVFECLDYWQEVKKEIQNL